MAVTNFLSAISPVAGTRYTTPKERRDVIAHVRHDLARPQTRYWLTLTDMSVDSVFDCPRGVVPRSAWTAEVDEPPWLILSRGTERLFLVVTTDLPRSGSEAGTKLLYGYTSDGR